MSPADDTDPKREFLRQQGTLNPHPEQVTDPGFRSHGFFDARDLVQVKYEMLRRVQRDGEPVSRSAKAFGFSRPAFYSAQTALASSGLPGLLPRRRGPRHPHKLSPEVLAFLRQQLTSQPQLKAAELARKVKAHCGVSLHPRTVERALRSTPQKKRQQP